MKADEHGITFTWPGFAAACLTVSSVLTALGASHLRLGLRPLHFLLLLVLLGLGGGLTAAVLGLGGAVHRFFLSGLPRPHRGARLLFWCLYPAALYLAVLLLMGYLPL